MWTYLYKGSLVEPTIVLYMNMNKKIVFLIKVSFIRSEDERYTKFRVFVKLEVKCAKLRNRYIKIRLSFKKLIK